MVLVGVSRTMKTPTMLYLAYSGWFAANVPLVPGIAPPKPLLAVAAERVFCRSFARQPATDARQGRGGIDSLGRLCSPDIIRRELAYADQLCRKHLWQRST